MPKKKSPDSPNAALDEFDAALHQIYSATDPDEFPDVVMPLLLKLTSSKCIGLCANALQPCDPFVAIAFADNMENPIQWQQFPQVSFDDHPTIRYTFTPAP